MSGYSVKLETGFAAGKHLCVGIDPHSHILEKWGLPDNAEGARKLGLSVVESCAQEKVLAVKPQIAFFERFGAAGFAALEEVLAVARDKGLLIIADVKRGDIGSTFAAYASAWLAPGSPLESDAMTVSPYMGFASLRAAYELAAEAQKGVFVLAATSNPEASRVQQARVVFGEGEQQSHPAVTVAQSVLEQALELNEPARSVHSGCDCEGQATASSACRVHIAPYTIGVVLGATVQLRDYGIDVHDSRYAGCRLPVLAPGFGAQGASLENVRDIFGNLTPSVIVNESRSLLSHPHEEFLQAVQKRVREIQRVFST